MRRTPGHCRNGCIRGAVAQEQRVQRLKNIISTHSDTNDHSQGLTGILVQDGQHLVAATVAELVVYEVDAPDMVGMGRPQPYDRSILVVEPTALFMTLRQLKAFFAPDPLNLLVVHLPAFDTQQFRYLAIAVAPILLRQPDQGEPQGGIVTKLPGRQALGFR